MLDITYFTMIDTDTPLEDITTPAGRLWTYGILNNYYETQGVSGVSWGRDTLDPNIVVLIAELDDQEEDQRPNLAIAASVFDVYLALPRVHQVLYDCDESLLTEQDQCLFLSFSFCHQDVGLSSSLVNWKIQHKGVQDFEHTVLVNGTLCHDTTSLCSTPRDRMGTYLLYNTKVTNRMIAKYHNRFTDPHFRPPEYVPFAHVHYNLFKLVNAPMVEPLYESPFLENPSHLFTRTKERYGKQILKDLGTDDARTDGPTIHKVFPYKSGTSVCFEKQSFAKRSPRQWRPRIWKRKQPSFWETASLKFLDRVPDKDDCLSPAGLAWWNFRKLITCAKGAITVHVAMYLRYLNEADIFIEWKNDLHSAMLFTSEIYETTIDALVPFLNIDTERTLRIPITQGVDYGINLVPIYALEWMDVVDFYFRANITETDKRAFEFLMIRFIASFREPQTGGTSTGHPIFFNDRRDHWIEDELTDKLIYRQEFYWYDEDEKEVLLWMKKYLETEYIELGIQAHAIALFVEERRHHRVGIEHLNREEHFGVRDEGISESMHESIQ